VFTALLNRFISKGKNNYHLLSKRRFVFQSVVPSNTICASRRYLEYVVSLRAFYHFEKLQLTDYVSALRIATVKLVVSVTSAKVVLKCKVVTVYFNFVDDTHGECLGLRGTR
jgi:hypothetical protein